MRDTSTLTLPDHQRLARAFLALTDDLAPEAVQRSLVKIAAAFAAALVLALAAPMTWLSPAPAVTPSKVGDQPAATLGNSKAALAAADDEDADGGG
jgi:predicted YcjX-like family ATPase